jgi:nitrogenase-associated protein
MAHVIFYQKPGCGTNGRQRAQLEALGHVIEARNLLSEPWSADRLLQFFGETPVASWFNPASPRVKSGEIVPARYAPDGALALMLADPLLIRRPLVETGEARCAGFDREPVVSLLAGVDLAGLQGCSHEKLGNAAGYCSAPVPVD